MKSGAVKVDDLIAEYNQITTYKDLLDAKLTLAEYRVLEELLYRLKRDGKVKTTYDDATRWLRDRGCNVTMDMYISYVITL